jgi:Uma2 family endonuclease
MGMMEKNCSKEAASMAVVTRLRLGPQDEGMPLSWEEYRDAERVPGFRYELIYGRLVVSPQPNFKHDRLTNYVDIRLVSYSQARPEVINYVSQHAVVFVPGEEASTCPEPDIAAYHNVPLHLQIDWEDIFPLLVVEVLSRTNPDKDWKRNLELYLRVPSIKEYWVIDGITDEMQPRMTVYRRWGTKWRKIEVPFDSVYTTRLLPDFELRMNPIAA